jgi:predicted RNase H-like nuclease
MAILIIGFDSAWNGKNHGAIVGVLKQDDDSHTFLGYPLRANFDEATAQINVWTNRYRPATTLIFIDQPIIVKNEGGQRDVENIISSSVGKRYGGVQPANRGKVEMFGDGAPIWEFLNEHGNCFDPNKFIQSPTSIWIIETYPVLTLIALNWLLEDDHTNCRLTQRLPKYNPERRRTFSLDDWKYVCNRTAKATNDFGLPELVDWLHGARDTEQVTKQLQDGLDACICLLVGLYLNTDSGCLMVGNLESQNPGYIVVPHGQQLHDELDTRCENTGRLKADWVRKLKF